MIRAKVEMLLSQAQENVQSIVHLYRYGDTAGVVQSETTESATSRGIQITMAWLAQNVYEQKRVQRKQ